MSNPEQITEVIEDYLRRVEAYTRNISKQEQTEILQNLKSHIYEALKTRNPGEPSLEDVKAVLGEMDPPESYSSMDKENVIKPNISSINSKMEPPKKKLCWQAVLGVSLIPIGGPLLLLLSFLGYLGLAEFHNGRPSLIALIIIIPLLIIGGISIFGSPLLGFIGISKIKNSEGRLTGMGWAIISALFYPILFLDGIIFMMSKLVDLETHDRLPEWRITLVLLAIVVSNILIIRWVRKSAQPPTLRIS